MANSKSTKNERKTVELIDPAGEKHNATHPAEVNNLIFGQGYKLADDKLTVDQAVASLLPDNEPTSAPANTTTL